MTKMMPRGAMIRTWVWSRKLPDLKKSPSLRALQVYDAIRKKAYAQNYNIPPSEVDNMSCTLMRVWDRISAEEYDKDKLQQNTGQ